jgi:hypothetical protein
MKNTKKAVSKKTAKNATSETSVHLAKTSYHFWRNWVKDILHNGKITSAKFVKENVGYDGAISVSSAEFSKAKAVLEKYKKDNADTVDMWK